MQKEFEKFKDSTIFEGMTSIRALLSARDSGSNDRKILEILYDTSRSSKIAKELRFLTRIGERDSFSVTGLTAAELAQLTLGNTHGGIIARCSNRTILDLATESRSIEKNGFYVLMEGIEDPYNFGYALRSLYACGATGIILPERNWMSAAGVVARSSAGASELFPIYQSSTETALSVFKALNYKIVCADIDTENLLPDTDLSLPLLLIVGGEKRGISRSVLDQADTVVKIPYGRDFRGALSAASATTILAYEILRQNR